MQNSLAAKIAESFINSAKAFQSINHILSNLGECSVATNPTPRHSVAPNVWVDFEADKNVATAIGPADGARGLRIETTDRSRSSWFSFSYLLPHDTIKEGRYLGVLIDMESVGVVAFRPCLRYISEKGFTDRFFRETIVSSGGEDEQAAFIKLDHELLAGAVTCELLLFFDGRKFDTTFRSIENLLIK